MKTIAMVIAAITFKLSDWFGFIGIRVLKRWHPALLPTPRNRGEAQVLKSATRRSRKAKNKAERRRKKAS